MTRLVAWLAMLCHLLSNCYLTTAALIRLLNRMREVVFSVHLSLHLAPQQSLMHESVRFESTRPPLRLSSEVKSSTTTPLQRPGPQTTPLRLSSEAKSLHGPLERLACTGVLVAASFRLTCGWDVEGGARASETCAVASALGHYLLRPKSGETGARLLARLCPLWPAAGMALCQGIRDGAVRTVLDDAGFDPAEGSMGDLEDIDLAVEVLRECQFACMEPEERLGRPGYALRGVWGEGSADRNARLPRVMLG